MNVEMLCRQRVTLTLHAPDRLHHYLRFVVTPYYVVYISVPFVVHPCRCTYIAADSNTYEGRFLDTIAPRHAYYSYRPGLTEHALASKACHSTRAQDLSRLLRRGLKVSRRGKPCAILTC